MQNIDLSFIRNYGPYVRGNIASFTPDSAKIIVQSGAAVVVTPEGSASADVMPERKHNKIHKK